MSQRILAMWGSIVIGVLGTLALAVSLSSGPDIELDFKREVGADITPAQVDAAWNNLSAWPNWFHSLAGVRVLSGSGRLAVGHELALDIDQKRALRKKFTLHAKVIEYVPQKKLVMRVTYDSKNSLTRMFDRLDWSLSLSPGAGRLNLLGEASAHTSHWRSRLFGRVTNQILMNQVFYPDLFKLAKINEAPQEKSPPMY